MAVTEATRSARDAARPARRSRRARQAWNPNRRRKSPTLTIVMTLGLIYSLFPLFWLVVNASKSEANLFSTNGLWFGGHFSLFANVKQTLTYNGDEFLHWFGNTLIYVAAGAGGATLLATLAGYGLARFEFPGKRGVLAIVLGAVAIPATILVVPTFLMFSKMGLVNTYWAIIIPSLINPFGLYLMWIFARDAIPVELLEAARVDGAREWRIFVSIALRLLRPGMITVLLFAVVQTWNNYFLPLVMLNKPGLYPLTVGLNQWNAQSQTAGGVPIFNLVLTGSLLMVIPIMVVFLVMQRYWQSGLAAGSVKQ
jgi:multiple sugar transport system permease protein